MLYELKQFDTPVLRFYANEESSEPDVKIIWINDDASLLPLDLEPTDDGLYKWLKNRTIPSNRAYVRNLLSKCGLNLNRPINIIKMSKGLSLNDCYWIVEENFDGKFEAFNLYDNHLSRVLANIAFTGYGSSIRSSLASSPEFTTNGMLPKCWRRIGGKIYLYKGGTSGASNTGMEPFSEFYAFQVAKAMNINAISYNICKWKGIYCSFCELFTSKDYSFIPVGRIVKTGGMKAVREYYSNLGDTFINALNDMIVFDALICNTDRHFGNFGFLVDSKTNKIVAPAPLFDHGNSLFNYAGMDDLESYENFKQYADTMLPRIYDDFILEARNVLTKEHKDNLRGMLNFKFKNIPTTIYPIRGLDLLNSRFMKGHRCCFSK